MGTTRLGLDLTAAQLDSLAAYAVLLDRWGRAHNLSGARGLDAIVQRHILDCAAVVPPLVRQFGGHAGLRLLDVGGGAGLPGVVLAAAQPSWSVTCVDAGAKKAAFVRQVAAELGLGNLRSLHSRVEALPPTEHFGVVTARAFSSLAMLVNLTRSRLRPGGAWVAMKGKLPRDELAGLPDDVSVFHVEPLDVPGLGAERCLVWIRPN